MSLLTSLRAPNPSAMTLDGTNTWLIVPADEPAIVIDPGPAIDSHLDALAAACPLGVREVWLTHHHGDHADGAPDFAERVGAPLRAYLEGLSTGEVLRDGDEVAIGGQRLRVIGTPGHTGDSLCFLLTGADGADLVTGDTVLGEGTTVILPPEGSLRAYLASLDRMESLIDSDGLARIRPGHGPTLNDPREVFQRYRRHRLQRLEQVREAVADGAKTAEDVVDRVYADVPDAVRFAAVASAQAQLDYLAEG